MSSKVRKEVDSQRFNSNLGNYLRTECYTFVKKYIEANKTYKISESNRDYMELHEIDIKDNIVSAPDVESLPDEPFDLMLASLFVFKYNECQRRGLEWGLSLAQLRKLMQRKTCYYTGVTMVKGDPKLRPTLERIDNSIGYTPENTTVVTWQANQIKNALFENERSDLLTDIKTMSKMLNVLQNK